MDNKRVKDEEKEDLKKKTKKLRGTLAAVQQLYYVTS